MLSNYLTTALRNLLKHKGYSLINILGLAVGTGSCLLLLLVARWETSYDTFHPDADRLYKVVRSTRMPDGTLEYGFRTYGPLGPALEEDFPEVESAIRFWSIWNAIPHEGKELWLHMMRTDLDVFDHFSFEIVAGDPKTVFAEPFAVFVTESLAKRFFADANPIGKTITIPDGHLPGDFVIRGILKDLPTNSHLRFDVLTGNVPSSVGNVHHLWESWRPLSNWRPVETFVKLKPGTDPAALEQKLDQVVEKHLGTSWIEKIGYRLTPIDRVWLFAEQDFGIDWYSDVALLYAVGIIAVSILLIACMNYVNLATARSLSRAAEVGLRKVVGAERQQIARQFLGESVLVACLASALGVLAVYLFLPTFNGLTGKNVPFDVANSMVILSSVCILIGVGFVSGIYPAAVLSSFAPATVLKGSMSRSSTGHWLRRVLIVAQFGVSVALGIGILMMDRQMAFIQTKDLGFARENIISVWGPFPYDIELERIDEFRREFGNHPSIISSCVTRDIPALRNQSNVIWIPERPDPIEIRGPMLPVDYEFLDTYQVPLVSGRNFSRDIASDEEEAFILTEKAARAFGWNNQNALGKTLGLPLLENRNGRPRGRVIGVVKDFHLNPLQQTMQPVVLLIWTRQLRHISLRYREGDRDAVIKHIEKVWNRHETLREPNYDDIEEILQWDYWQERQLISMSRIFGIVALGVACIGLLGLTAFSTHQRLGEVGIRKVLGGRPLGLVALLTKEVVALVTVANIIGAPFGYWLVTNWMQVFQYRVAFNPSILAYTVALSLAIAIATVSYQTLSAVRTNPVDVLRAE